MEVRGDWLRKAEDYTRATSVATVDLGLAPNLSTAIRPKPTWPTSLQAARQLATPLVTKATHDQELNLHQDNHTEKITVVSPKATPTHPLELFPFADNSPTSSLGGNVESLFGTLQVTDPAGRKSPPSKGANHLADPAQRQASEPANAQHKTFDCSQQLSSAQAEQDEVQHPSQRSDQTIDQLHNLRGALFSTPPPPVLAAPTTPPPKTRSHAPLGVILRCSVRLATKQRPCSMLHRA